MKKIIALATLILILAAMLVSCGTPVIRSVKVDDIGTYQTVYLYSFKEADVDGYRYKDSEGELSKTGFIYTTSKYNSGDKIRVYSELQFYKDEYYFKNGTAAY